jgi:hypothetical protein
MIRMVLAAPLIVLGWESLNPAHASCWWDGVARRYCPVEGADQPPNTRPELTVGMLSDNGTIVPGIVQPQKAPSPAAGFSPTTSFKPLEPIKPCDSSGAPFRGHGDSPHDLIATPNQHFLPRPDQFVAIGGTADSLAARVAEVLRTLVHVRLLLR